MKNNFPETISIPSVMGQPSFNLQTSSEKSILNLIDKAQKYFRKSGMAWVKVNAVDENMDGKTFRKLQTDERENAKAGAKLLSPLGICVSWPGLYPVFAVNEKEEFSTCDAVLSALGKPRNFVKAKGYSL